MLSIADKMIVNNEPHINIPPNIQSQCQTYSLLPGFMFSSVLYFDVAVVVLVVVVQLQKGSARKHPFPIDIQFWSK